MSSRPDTYTWTTDVEQTELLLAADNKLATHGKSVRILGTRGVPASHGGFETFAEHLALYLVQRGWTVTVYCQEIGKRGVQNDKWKGIDRVHIGTPYDGALGTVEFDFKAVWHAVQRPDIVLTLGYNTAIFNVLLKIMGRPDIINMDGLEWQRKKWSASARLWLRLNEWVAGKVGTTLIADHPEIAKHLLRVAPKEKIVMIPYDAQRVDATSFEPLTRWDLETQRFGVIIARPEPENSLLEIVRAWSRRSRAQKLVVLGKLDPSANAYHAAVVNAAGPGVIFAGAIYDQTVVRALRVHASVYLHGHQVGGTNPSLVEALACGSPVIAHDNNFNRWTSGPTARFFCNEEDLAALLDQVLDDPVSLEEMRRGSRTRHQEAFTPEDVLGTYEALLIQQLDAYKIDHIRKPSIAQEQQGSEQVNV
jgi:glycosyltransferase involved in cell wall biosynthesis